MQGISDPTTNLNGTLNLDGTLEVTASVVNSMSRHLKDVAVEMAGMSLGEFERGAGLVGELAGVRTFDRLVEIETNYLKSAHQAFSQHALRLRDLYAAIGQDLTKPMAGTNLHGKT